MLSSVFWGNWSFSPYVLPPLLAAVIALPVAAEAWRNREEPAAEALLVVVLALFCWSALYAVELGFTAREVRTSWRAATLVVGATLPPLWLLFTFRYAGLDAWLGRPVQVVLAGEPLVYTLLVLTNANHGLVWTSVTGTDAPGLVLGFTPLYYAHLGYLYLLVVVGMGALAWVAADAGTIYRRQSAVLLVAAFIPLLANAASKAGLSPFPGVDLTTFGFALAVSLIALAMFRLDLLDVAPVAHRRWLDKLEDGIVVVDREGRVVESNSVAKAALTPEPTPGTAADEVLPAPTDRTIDATVDGELRFYDVHRTTLTDHRDEPAGSLLGLREVTDRTEYERRLEVANRVLRHNFRNAMNVVQGRATLLSDALDGEQAEHARVIEHRASEVIELNEGIQQMVATIDRTGSTETVDVATVAASVVDDYRQQFPDVRFTVDAEPAPAVVTERKLFATALGHLVENAAAYNDADQPAVAVTVSSDGDRVTVRVRDNGPGIPAPERAVLTEGRETPLSHGSGLGLWLVSWTVDSCNGELRFEENTPRGSVVVVELPAAGASE